MRLAVAGLAVVLLLSGCTSPLGGSNVEGSTVTPAPVPTEAPGPPGVDPARDVLDAEVLVSAHEQVVQNGSVAVRLESRRRPLPNGTERVRREVSVFTDTPSVFYRYSNDSVGFTRGVWSNGTHTVTYVRNPDVISLQVSASPSLPEESVDQAHATELTTWLSHSQIQSIDRVETSEGVRYRVQATSSDSELLGTDPALTRSGVANATLVAEIRPDGLVTSLRLEYTLLTRDGRFHTTHRLTTTTDVESLPRPPWVERAIAEGNQTRKP